MSQDQKVKELTSRIADLEKCLSESENKSKEMVQLARDIALSAVQHVRKVESEAAELYAMIEEIEQVSIKAYQKRITDLENELKIEHIKVKKLQAEKRAQIDTEHKELEPPKNTSNLGNTISRQSSIAESTGSVSVKNPARAASIVVTSTNVVREGYMLKKSPAMFKGWQKRYFVLTDDLKFTWYEREQDYKKRKPERGSVSLSGITTESIHMSIKWHDVYIKLIVEGKTYDLDCGKEEEAGLWFSALTQVCIR